MLKEKKKIGIIGSGPAGLIAIKYALQYGLSPEVFQKSSGFGGIWNPDTGKVWKQMTTNLSKYTISFRGYPWPEQTSLFPTSDEVIEYLTGFAKKFHLLDYVNFNSQVVSVVRQQKGSDNVYTLTVKKGESLFQRTYQCLIIATGIFNLPYIPEIEGLKNFKGKIIHSSSYRDGQAYKGKKVLVVGGSLTAIELSANISKYAEKTYHTFKKNFWVAPHYIQAGKNKLPWDILQNRQFYLSGKNSNPRYQHNLKMFNTCKEQQQIPEIRVDQSLFNQPVYQSISTIYVSQCKKGQIVPIKSTIQKFEDNSVILFVQNQQKKEIICQIDQVILCTGYNPGLHYLSKEIQQILEYKDSDRFQPLILYNQMIHPKLQNLFFVGIYKDAIFPIMEFQTQFAIRKFCGLTSLPSQDQITKGLKEEKQIRNQLNRPQQPHPNFIQFADKLSKEAGYTFDIESILNDSTNEQNAQYLKMSAFGCVENSFTTNNISQQIKETAKILQRICSNPNPIHPSEL